MSFVLILRFPDILTDRGFLGKMCIRDSPNSELNALLAEQQDEEQKEGTADLDRGITQEV